MDNENTCWKLLSGMSTPGGVSDKKIEAAENELGVTFPMSYRKFLSEYGAAQGIGFEIAGLYQESSNGEPPMWRSIVTFTKQIRRAVGGAIASSMIPISDDGEGIVFYLDSSGGQNCPIIAYGPGVDGVAIANSFEEFIVRQNHRGYEPGTWVTD